MRPTIVPEDIGNGAAERRSLMRSAAALALTRQATALVLAKAQRKDLSDVVRQNWPVTRAATSPAMTTVSGWAAELVGEAVADALIGLAPASVSAKSY
jgi:hypothetical protein